jgi:hypothetical protein
LNNVEDEIISSLEGLDEKHKLLKDQVSALTRVFEEEQAAKEVMRRKQIDDMNSLEIRVKKYLLDERDVNSNNIEL